MPRARNPENTGIFVPGQVSYLPKRQYSDVLSPTDSEIPDGCYNHPVLILSTDPRKKKAEVLILTSLGGKTLDERSWKSEIRAFHLPIHPSPAHPDNGILLYLDQGLKLPKRTYVKTATSFSIHWKQLQADYGEHSHRTSRRYRLKPDSFTQVLDYIKIGGGGGGGPVRHSGKPPEAPETTPRHLPSDLQAMFDRLESMTAATGNVSASSPTTTTSPSSTAPPPTSIPKPPKYYSVQAPMAATAASTLQSVARSREGVAAERDRYIAQWRGGQQLREPQTPRHEPRSILPTYRISSPSDPAVGSRRDPVLIFRRAFVVLVVLAVFFLLVAWWQCQLWACN